MQKKLFKIIFYFCFLALSFSICYVYKSFNSFKSTELFKLNEDIKTLIIGDSRTMTSLDPNIIKFSRNISLDSENYFFTYFKLKLFLLNNSKIKNVIIGFSPNSISKIWGEKFLFNEIIEEQSYERYYNIIDYNGKNKIKSFRKYFIEAVLKYEVGIPVKIYKDERVIQYLFRKNIKKSDIKFIGGYYESKKSNINKEDIKKSIQRYFYNDYMKYPGKSDLNIEYLHKIINICSSRGNKILLYRAPAHEKYLQNIPKEALKDFEEIKNEILENYKNIEYVDYSTLQIETKCYGDGDHVNSCGAEVVSLLINSKINKDNSNNM